MKRTFNKTITKEGMNRKVDRLIVKSLATKFPTIYGQLLHEAHAVIAADNADPRSKVVTTGLDTMHRKSDLLQAMELVAKYERQQWVNDLMEASTDEERRQIAGMLGDKS